MAKLEMAEARHKKELQSLRAIAEEARAEALEAKEEANRIKEEAETSTGKEDSSKGEGGGHGDVSVPAFTPAQLNAIEEATSREKEYLSQLETAREALEQMREKLAQAEAKENKETEELRLMSRDTEKQHQNQLQKLRADHRAQMLRIVAASSRNIESEADAETRDAALLNDDSLPNTSAATVALQAITADMERHEEESRQQIKTMQKQLAETERIHREQLHNMEQRHRKELEQAAIGTTARAVAQAITDSAAINAAKARAFRSTEDDSGLEVDAGNVTGNLSSDVQTDIPLTARQALHDIQHSAELYAEAPSPKRRDSSVNDSSFSGENAVEELKALVDAAREKHAREMQMLKEQHQAELERVVKSDVDTKRQSNSQQTRLPSASDEDVLALRQECDRLRSLLSRYDAQNSVESSASDVIKGLNSARAAVLRPIVRGLHLDSLKKGFTALNSERKRAQEDSKLAEVKVKAAKVLRCVALRTARDLMRLGWARWRKVASSVAHDLHTALAVQSAVAESGDAVRAQGLELYCVELQQRMKEMQQEAAEREHLIEELHQMDWPRVVLKQKRTIHGLQEQVVALKKEIEDERAAFARAMNKAMSAISGDNNKRNRRGRTRDDSRTNNAHNLQEFITDISRQVSRHREEVLEWQRRHKQSTKAWVST